jgi:hypothetical protein
VDELQAAIAEEHLASMSSRPPNERRVFTGRRGEKPFSLYFAGFSNAVDHLGRAQSITRDVVCAVETTKNSKLGSPGFRVMPDPSGFSSCKGGDEAVVFVV